MLTGKKKILESKHLKMVKLGRSWMEGRSENYY
jgi:hypothetical protein